MIIISDYDSIIKKFNELSIESHKPFIITNNFIFSLIKKSIFKFLPKYENIYYNKSVFKLTDPHMIIVFDGSITRKFLENISNKYKNSRLIFWYWNPIRLSIKLEHIPQKFEIWTYSKQDAINYGLNLNSQISIFDLSSIGIEKTNGLISYFGRDKGRYKKLKKIEQDLNKNGHSTYFHITANRRFFKTKKYKKNVSYETVINICSKSKAILDYYLNNTDGYSLRTVEAILLNKKLITNNVNIVDEKFYHPNNIFLLKEDNITELDEFFKNDIIPYSKEVINYFQIEAWLARFGEIK